MKHEVSVATWRRAIPFFLISVFILLCPVMLRADAAPGAGFADSPHDFSGKGAGNNQRQGNGVTTGPCTFCHTPHKALKTRLLWNHTLPNTNYTWGDITHTMGGTQLPQISNTWTGPTRFCLSCHDGAVAIGDIAWFNRQSWTGGAAVDDKKHDSGQYNIASPAGSMTGNHPVGHPYPFGKVANTYNSVTTGATVYLTDFNTDPTAKNIRLFSDATGIVVAGAVAGKTGIECTSCHGVHNETGIVKDEPLLRGTKGGKDDPEYICMKCHTR